MFYNSFLCYCYSAKGSSPLSFLYRHQNILPPNSYFGFFEEERKIKNIWKHSESRLWNLDHYPPPLTHYSYLTTITLVFFNALNLIFKIHTSVFTHFSDLCNI